jgi:hypothetical protein
MEYVISESRLERIFKNFMDSQYDLTYDSKPREFVDKNGEVFGFVAFNSMKHIKTTPTAIDVQETHPICCGTSFIESTFA